MKRVGTTLIFIFTATILWGQGKFSVRITDSRTAAPVVGATVILNPGKHMSLSDESGTFSFPDQPGRDFTLTISAVGYDSRTISSGDVRLSAEIRMVEKMSQLSEVVITPDLKNPNKNISEADISYRGVSNSQEVLRLVPGLFIGQHQGGGKAEQIFLRGFDNDHGRDIALYVDGMPINLVSHAHGQGYADSHFIIPETIARTGYEKGVYNVEKGDLAVSGSVDFHTLDAIDKSSVKLEAGQFDTYRLFGMVNLLNQKSKLRDRSWYAASEYRYSNSYFENPQHFNRFNFFTKARSKLSDKSWLSASATFLSSDWKASGQIPEHGVNEGLVSYYGTIVTH